MPTSLDQTANPWRDALTAAIAAEADGSELTLYHERRRDVVVEVLGGGAPAARSSRWSGLRAERGAVRAWLADPVPDDVPALARATAADRPRIPGRAAGRPADLPAMDDGALDEPAVRLARDVEAHLAGRLPGVSSSVRWTRFVQEIGVARVGMSGAAVDRRVGGALRVELRLTRRGRAVRAVAELPATDPSSIVVADLVADLARRLRRRSSSQPPPSGERQLVLAPGVGGVVIHELIGHALEGDIAVPGRSWLADPRRGLAAGLTVVDDPRRSRAAWHIDDEGVACGVTPLVRDGRVTGVLHDRASAAAAAVDPTGHARRATYRDSAMPRMGCTFVAAGREAADDLITSVEDGIYVRRLEAGGVSPSRGVAWFHVADADRIVRGSLTAAIEAHALMIDGARALAGPLRIAGDLAFDPSLGHCMRLGQAMVTSVGAPTMWIGLGGYVL